MLRKNFPNDLKYASNQKNIKINKKKVSFKILNLSNMEGVNFARKHVFVNCERRLISKVWFY